MGVDRRGEVERDSLDERNGESIPSRKRAVAQPCATLAATDVNIEPPPAVHAGGCSSSDYANVPRTDSLAKNIGAWKLLISGARGLESHGPPTVTAPQHR